MIVNVVSGGNTDTRWCSAILTSGLPTSTSWPTFKCLTNHILLSPFPPPYAWHFLPASPYRCLHFFGLVKHRRKESCLLLFRKPVLAASSDHESSQPAPLGFSWLWQEFPTKSSCFSILLDKTLTSTSNCPSYCCAPTCATQTTSQPVLQVYQALVNCYQLFLLSHFTVRYCWLCLQVLVPNLM